MKKGQPTTSCPDDKNFNPIVAFESDVVKDKFKELALIVALKEVAKQNDLSIRQQVEIYSPKHWNNSPGQNLDKEFESFKRCGSQGFIAITEEFDNELANKGWYTQHLTFKNKQIIIDPETSDFTSNKWKRRPKKCL